MLKIISKRGGFKWFLLVALSLAAFAVFCHAAEAVSYAGNIYVSKAIAGSAYLLDDSSPVDPGTFNLRSADDMPEGSKYTPSDTADGLWKKIQILETTVSSVYVLLVSGNNYYVHGSFALGTNQPTVNKISATSWYLAATPPAPITDITLTLDGLTYPDYNGIVTSSIGGLDPGYQQTGTKYELYAVTGGSDGDTEGDLSEDAVKSGSGTLSSWEILDSAGKRYRVKMCYVNKFTDNNENWGESKNKDIPDTEAGPIDIEYTLAAGIEQFAVSVDPAKNDFKVNDESLDNNIDAFLKKVDTSGKITTFGWWDEGLQLPVGYIITWAEGVPEYQIVNAAPVPAKTALVKDKVYQMRVTEEISFKLTGTR